jgi:hypothetical protein
MANAATPVRPRRVRRRRLADRTERKNLPKLIDGASVLTRVAKTLAATGLVIALAGCGLFGVKGPGLQGKAKSLDPNCSAPPYELAANCPLGGIGADVQIFDNFHAYVGSTQVIAGSTNYLNVKTAQGRVTSFVEQFHPSPPFSDREARLVADPEVPYDSKRAFVKTVGGMCEVLEYTSARLRKLYGKAFSAVRIVLQSPDPQNFDKTNVSMATISLTAPHSRASVNSC